MRRLAAVAAFDVAIVGLLSNVLFLAAFRFRPEWALDPVRMIEGGRLSAELLRWAAITDLFGYYVPMLPIIAVSWTELHHHSVLAVSSACVAALAYVVIGGTAAAALAIVGPPLIESFAAGDPAARPAFETLIDLVFRAAWQTVGLLLIGGWFVVIGALHDQPTIRSLSLAIGSTALAGVAANVTDLDLLRDAFVTLALGLWLVWAVLVGSALHGGTPPVIAPGSSNADGDTGG
jgi:hypothetical protein